jgi:CRP/FNR family transcriptional regulator, cyclic AMP receptor protein
MEAAAAHVTPAEADEILNGIPIFAGLDQAERKALFALMTEESIKANQTIFWLGEKGDNVYLVASGEVAVTVPNEAGEHVMLNRIVSGGFFGEISLLDGGPRTATVRALEDTRVLVLRRDSFHSFIRTHPDAAIEVLTVMGQRQRESTLLLRAMKNPNLVFEQRMTTWQKVSDIIATTAASQFFTIFHLIWFGGWIGINAVGMMMDNPPHYLAFDPFPFGLLTMVVSLEAIFLSIFVMVSQNRQSEKDRLRTDLDYQVNLKAQTEIMHISKRLEQIEDRLLAEIQEVAEEVDKVAEEVEKPN